MSASGRFCCESRRRGTSRLARGYKLSLHSERWLGTTVRLPTRLGVTLALTPQMGRAAEVALRQAWPTCGGSERCRQRELELSPARPAQSQAAEPQDTLEMCKQHLNAFSIVARSLECFSLGQRASNVTSVLVDATRHPAERRLWAAMRLQWAATAVAHAGHIQQCLTVIDEPTGRCECLAGRAGV